MKIAVETLVRAPLDKVWRAYTTPADIVQWNTASDDWHTTRAEVDLRVGGSFSSRMEAKDGSFGFDFAGTYTQVEPHALLEYSFGDRRARVEFSPAESGIGVRVLFDAENEHPVEQQRQGWQSILDSFARYVEALGQRTFSSTRRLAASPAAIFAALQDPTRLARWWGPQGFTNRFDLFDFQNGGRWEFDMIGPDGTVYPNQSVFSRIEADRCVVIDHVCAPFFQLSIRLEPVADGTLLYWDQCFADAAVAQSVRHIVEPANAQNLDRLSAELGLT